MRALALILIFLWGQFSYSQCCTSGCCAPGTANFGVLEKGDLLAFSFFKHSYSDKYYRGDSPLAFSYLKNDYADYSGLSLSYGISNKVTAQVSLGYFITKTENFDLPLIGQQQFLGSGLADMELYLKYNLFKSKNDLLNITVSGGAKLPTGPYSLKVNDVILSRDVQPGTGAYSGVFIFYAMLKPFKDKKKSIMFNSRTDHNGVNRQGFQYGVANTNTLSSAIKIYKDISFIMMLRNENKDCDRVSGKNLFSSSSYRVFAAPGVQISGPHDISFALFGDMPIYQYYAGTQLAGKYSFSVAFSKVFEFHKKELPDPTLLPAN